MYLKSPQVSSKEKGKKAEIRKNLDKNKQYDHLFKCNYIFNVYIKENNYIVLTSRK